MPSDSQLLPRCQSKLVKGLGREGVVGALRSASSGSSSSQAGYDSVLSGLYRSLAPQSGATTIDTFDACAKQQSMTEEVDHSWGGWHSGVHKACLYLSLTRLRVRSGGRLSLKARRFDHGIGLLCERASRSTCRMGNPTSSCSSAEEGQARRD